jgi:hypothetical protein
MEHVQLLATSVRSLHFSDIVGWPRSLRALEAPAFMVCLNLQMHSLRAIYSGRDIAHH